MDTPPVNSPLGVARTLFMMLVIVVAVVTYLLIGGLLGLVPLYAGFLFILYWSGIDQCNPKQFSADLIGAMGGSVNAWLIYFLPQQMQTAGVAVSLAVIGVAVFCQIRRQLPLLFNMSYMFFLTVIAIPGVIGRSSILEIVAAIVFGAIYIRAVFFAIGKLQAFAARRAADPTPGRDPSL